MHHMLPVYVCARPCLCGVVICLQITVSVATDRAALATGLARGLEIGSCAFSGANTF